LTFLDEKCEKGQEHPVLLAFSSPPTRQRQVTPSWAREASRSTRHGE